MTRLIDQCVDLECYATKGIGETHAKWSPVCTAAYRMRPEITFPHKVVGETARRIASVCPMGVFDIEDINGEDTLRVKKDLNCTQEEMKGIRNRMCRECIRLPENREHVSLNVIRNDFIFSVESTGCVSAETLLPRVQNNEMNDVKALKVLKDKCETIIREVEAIETGGVGMQEEETEEMEMEEEED